MLTRQIRPLVAVCLLTSIFLLIYRSAYSPAGFDLSSLQTSWSNGHYDLDTPSKPVEIIDNDSTVVSEGDDPPERPAAGGIQPDENRKAVSAGFVTDAEKPDDLLSDEMLGGGAGGEEQKGDKTDTDGTDGDGKYSIDDVPDEEADLRTPEGEGEAGEDSFSEP